MSRAFQKCILSWVLCEYFNPKCSVTGLVQYIFGPIKNTCILKIKKKKMTMLDHKSLFFIEIVLCNIDLLEDISGIKTVVRRALF